MRLAIFLLLTTLVMNPVASEPLSADERRMAEWIDAHADDAIALLQETVDIPSGTMNQQGVREVGAVMDREFREMGMVTLLSRVIQSPPVT